MTAAALFICRKLGTRKSLTAANAGAGRPPEGLEVARIKCETHRLAMSHYRLLVADQKGTVYEHPTLLATVRSDETVSLAQGRPIAIPQGATLAHLPGRLPVGYNPKTGELELVSSFQVGKRRFSPHAVGAVLPPGFTRTHLPGEAKHFGPVLPQWAYTAAAWSERGPVVWAIHTDRRKHWTPERFSTPEVKRRVKALTARYPDNQVYRQLTTCALVYRCFTSQNIFFGRDEGAIPASVSCNARCVGCISEQPEDGPEASHERMREGPTAAEMAEVALEHLKNAPGRTMVSFGQGCEGEPLTRYKEIAKAISLIRSQTRKGSININTNGSLTHGLAALFEVGLDAVRVSLNSCVSDLYSVYYQPVKYSFVDVEASLKVARSAGAYVAINLLLFPGVSDRVGEVDALIDIVKKYRVDQIQTRPLAIDPLQYIEVARNRGAGGEAIGIGAMLSRLRKHAPWLVIGNFARGLSERRRVVDSSDSNENHARRSGRRSARLH
jgi:molybdenum cofactor biosynthesis enzyme MoaA